MHNNQHKPVTDKCFVLFRHNLSLDSSAQLMAYKHRLVAWSNIPNITALDESTLTILPFPGGWVDDAKQLVIGHSLRVDINGNWLQFHVLIRLHQ